MDNRVKQSLETAIASIEQAKRDAIANALSKNRTEVITPKLQEVDNALAKALAARKEKFNSDLAELQKEYDAEVAQITAVAAEKKASFVNAQETAIQLQISAEIDQTIVKLKELVG